MAHVVEIYGAGAAVGKTWVRSMGQELLWGTSVSDLWGRSCCGAHVGRSMWQELLWGRSMGQELLWR